MNDALQNKDKASFVKHLIDGLQSPPKYFPLNVSLNKKGYDSVDNLLQQHKQPLTLQEFDEAWEDGAVILDTRDPEQFAQGFVPASLNIPLDGRFAEWVGKLLDEERPVLLVTEPGKEEETIIRMARVGYENVYGYLKGGIRTWKEADRQLDMVVSIDSEEFELDSKHDEDIVVVDVRTVSEFNDDHLDGAMNIPLYELEGRLKKFDNKDKVYVHCQTGYRSMIASSIFKKHHINNIRNVEGGYESIKEKDIGRYRSFLIDN